MSTHESAPTQFVDADGFRIAHRRFGRSGGAPLLLLNYLAANMDGWDPLVTNGLAADHEVVIFDYPGVGSSAGQTPSTIAALTRASAAFARAVGLARFDVLGFSLGGMIAQLMGAEHPELASRIILLGTGPQGGEGMVFDDLSPDELINPTGLILGAFFTQSEASQAAGRAFLERLRRRGPDRDAPVSRESAVAQIAAIREWGVIPSSDRFAMLGKIPQPVLIIHGAKDVVVTPINAFLLEQHLPNARLVMYPDASHGAQSQHAENFLQQVKLFLP